MPANSVTVITDSSKLPTVIPPSVTEKTPGVSSNPTIDVVTPAAVAGITSNVAFGDTANLTTLGNLDWAHWWGNVADVSGTKTAQISSNRKVGVVTQDIADLEVTNLDKHDFVIDNTGYKINYSDGLAPTTASDDNKGFSFGPQVNAWDNPGVKFTVKAGTKQRTVSIFVGVKGSKAKLTATLNDGSGAVYESNVDGAAVSEADTTKPSIPQNLSIIAVSKDEAAIKWNPSTDNMGVAGYRVYSGGEFIGTTTKDNTNFYWNGLRPSSEYLFTVKAIDATGNISDTSETLAVTTKADVVPPVSDVTVLKTSITTAQALYDSAEKGTGNGNAVGLKAKLQAAITHAKTVVTSAAITSQRDIDAEVITLNAAAEKLGKHYTIDPKKEK